MTTSTLANKLYDLYRTDGGGTVWLNTEYTTGYVVALPTREVRISDYLCRPAFIEYYLENCVQPGSDGVGIWRDGDNVYIDSVLRIGNRDVALNLGRSYEQLAIYDLAAGEVIDL